MDLIVAHEAMDFDGFASAVAAQRLYPGAVIGLPRQIGRDLRRFLSLHKDRFAAERLAPEALGAVRRLIVVDVRDRRRLGFIAPVLARIDAGEAIEVHVWDHHPASSHDLTGAVERIEPVGAVTTLLVEELHARGVEIDEVEATLFSLGIYVDTLALTLVSTTPRDVRAAAWLLERGASLPIVNRYLAQGFSEAQRAALAEVLSRAREVEQAGARFGVVGLVRERHVEGLDEVVSEARRLFPFDAIVVACGIPKKNKVEVVARAKPGPVDVGELARALGGGGHRGAAAAVVRDATVEQVLGRIEAALRRAKVRPERVADVMSGPVRSVSPELPLRELGRRLARWGHSGVPVMRAGELLGVASRRDVQRAEEAGRADLPVASHMTGRVITTTPETSLEAALEALVAADVGRLLVVRDDPAHGPRVVGIVSRSDLIEGLYGGSAAPADAEAPSDAPAPAISPAPSNEG